MSTNFRVIPAVLFSDLFDGALEVFEVREHDLSLRIRTSAA